MCGTYEIKDDVEAEVYDQVMCGLYKQVDYMTWSHAARDFVSLVIMTLQKNQ